MNARSRQSGEPLASIKSSRRVRHRAARSAHIPVFSSCSFAIPRRAEPRRAMERIDDVKCLEHPLNVGFGGGLHPPNRQWAGIFRCRGIRGGLDPVDKFVRRKFLESPGMFLGRHRLSKPLENIGKPGRLQRHGVGSDTFDFKRRKQDARRCHDIRILRHHRLDLIADEILSLADRCEPGPYSTSPCTHCSRRSPLASQMPSREGSTLQVDGSTTASGRQPASKTAINKPHGLITSHLSQGRRVIARPRAAAF